LSPALIRNSGHHISPSLENQLVLELEGGKIPLEGAQLDPSGISDGLAGPANQQYKK
jgi:hypothetical protein